MVAFSPFRTRTLRTALFVAVLGPALFAAAQSSHSSPQKPCATPCPTPPVVNPDATPAKSFPYPGESKPAPQSSTPVVPDAPSGAPGASAPSIPGAAPSKQFPYPGEAHPADSSSSGSSSSSSSSGGDSPDPAGSPAAVGDSSAPSDDTATDKFPRRRLPKVRNLQTDEERENEDLTVARFYRSKGNWNAAYLRSKDAVKHGPDDPDAHLLLAESALKVNKKDEAVTEYNALLKLDASDEQIKTAHKALEKLK